MLVYINGRESDSTSAGCGFDSRRERHVLYVVYEPKFKLNKRDETRWLALVAREACELGSPNKKFPPLSLAEREELEKLTRKSQCKRNRRPKMKAYLRRHRRQMNKTEELAALLEALCKRNLHKIKRHIKRSGYA